MSVRKTLQQYLEARPWTLRELCEALQLPTRTVEDHLHHLQRSLRREGRRLCIHPARCRHCGFTFTQERFTRPGRCPRCKSTWIEAPSMEITADGCRART